MTVVSLAEARAKKPRAKRYGEPELVRRITNALIAERSCAMEAGKFLQIAHDELFASVTEAFGDRDRAWAKWLRDKFGIAKSTAAKYMAIARNEVIREYSERDVSPGKLPSEHTILYTLSRVPDGELREAIESGYVKPGMSRKEAVWLADKTNPSPQKRRKPQESCNVRKPVTERLRMAASGALTLDDDDVNDLGGMLVKVLSDVQREALRDLLARP